jgi:2-C-methyl-D-erythritol 4-phosphate cytidylyltransferase
VDIIIAAAGSGSRYDKNSTPKQFLVFKNKEVLSLNIEKWINLKEDILIKDIYVVLPNSNFENLSSKYKKKYPNIITVMGGVTRGESILNALKLSTEKNVMIHDGARPFFSKELVFRVYNKLKVSNVVIPILPITDTLKIVKNYKVEKTLNREDYFTVQTPQAFNKEIIKKAYLDSGIFAYDDSELLEKQNIDINTVIGEWNNIKITTKEQNRLINFLMQQED